MGLRNLQSGTSHAGIIKSQAEQQLLAYQKNLWPTQGIPFPDADIANRDPFKEEENKGIIDTIKGWFSSKPEGANLSIEELEELSPELDRFNSATVSKNTNL